MILSLISFCACCALGVAALYGEFKSNDDEDNNDTGVGLSC